MIELHDTLNPKIWDAKNSLLPDVQTKILQIVEEFISNLEIHLDVADIHLVGSNASYNYTEYSDLDVHIITNMELYDSSQEIIQAYFNAERSNFNKNYDISIKGIHVELYVEDINASTFSNGIYSVFENRWIIFPKKLENIPQIDISKEVSLYLNKINNLINNNLDINNIINIINKLYIIRKNSLLVDGEFGKGNLIFKELRNLGLLDKLKDLVKQERSKQLTLEGLLNNHGSLDDLFEGLNKLEI